MKAKPLTFASPAAPTLAFLPAQRDYLRKITDPQDLEEALLSVRHDELLAGLLRAIDEVFARKPVRVFVAPFGLASLVAPAITTPTLL